MGMIKHLILTFQHKYFVFLFALRLGIPYRGFMHDWSKLSFEELLTSGKYYTGVQSPQIQERNANDNYSKVSVHHVGRNKHHWQYWVDYRGFNTLVYCIPYVYAVEFVCDSLAASRVYNGKHWERGDAYQYFNHYCDKCLMHPSIKEFASDCFAKFRDEGFKGLTKTYTKEHYAQCSAKYPRVIQVATNFEGLQRKSHED